MREPPLKIWVTQTLPRAHDSARDYEALGLDPFISPLLTVALSDDNITRPIKNTCLIFTAQNGVRAFVKKHTSTVFTVICVGDATAQCAREYGFQDVHSANGTAQDVIKLVQQTIPKSTLIRHCAGRHVRGRIVETLSELGYQAERFEYYASKPVESCAVDIASLDYVTFYSPLGAQTFAKLLHSGDMRKLTALSISPATDQALGELEFKKRLIASAPNQTSMISTLRDILPAS